MSAITAWIRALAGAAVFCAIALALCPEGRPKRVLRAACGVVMAAAGRVLAELPLPIGGLMSDRPAVEVADRLRELLRLADAHYHIWEQADAFMTLSFLALPVIPDLKTTARGLFDVSAFRFVDVDMEKRG